MDDLIRRAKQKDADAFIELMQQNMQSMYKVAKAILRSDEDVADAVQETILACWEKLGQLRREEYFKTWLIRILINKCNDMLRSRDRISPGEMREISFTENAFSNLEWNETLKTLDEKYRLVLMLYYVEGFRTSEISRILEIPEATVRTRLARGRERLSDICQTGDDSASVKRKR